ncbi:hypothetical protein SLS53_000693 [Cytospora paraplurivora]|uniref:Uncharacterized protein n=1 Tax=Cytospora paraplurivora TaxID=2898453 RepID=A0AAN9UJB9_9PEZI
MATGQSPTPQLQYQQSSGLDSSSLSQPPVFPPPPSGYNTYGTLPGAQIPADATSLTNRLDQSFPKPVRVYSPQEVPANIKAARTSVEYGLGQLRDLQQRRYRSNEVGVEERLRIQAASVLGDLRALRGEVLDVVGAAERHRWRKWLLGGVA